MAPVLALAGRAAGGGPALLGGVDVGRRPLIDPAALPMLLSVSSGTKDVDEDADGAEDGLREIRVEVPAWS